MTNGFDLYNSSRTTPLKSFEVPTTKIYAKKGVFGEKGHIIVTGSDHGMVYVFAVKTDSMQKLEHGSKGIMIQSVEVKVLPLLEMTCRSTLLIFFIDNYSSQSSSYLQRIFGEKLEYMYLGEIGTIFCYN